MTSLELQNIEMRFGKAMVLRDLSLDVQDGEFLVLVGPSGCGKSTLLRIVAGLTRSNGGQVLMDGRSVDALSPGERDVAMVFQDYALYPNMRVRANIGFPLKMRKQSRDVVERRVAEVADVLGLTDLLDRRPSELSGGQMQRVALGRAIIRDPKLFLFDEPLSNLDAQLRGGMRREIAALHQRLGITTLYVTHDWEEAMTLGARVAVLRDGKIEQVGEPLALFERPETVFVASFIGSPSMNLISGEAAAGRFVAGAMELKSPIERGRLTLGIRPHQIELGGALQARVIGEERLGTSTQIELDVGTNEALRVTGPGDLSAPVGSELAVGLTEESCHWFDAEGRRLGSFQ